MYLLSSVVALLPLASDKKPIIFVVKILPEVDGASNPPNPPPLAAPAPEIAVKALLLIIVVVIIVALDGLLCGLSSLSSLSSLSLFLSFSFRVYIFFSKQSTLRNSKVLHHYLSRRLEKKRMRPGQLGDVS